MAELQRQIEERFGLRVNRESLERFLAEEPVRDGDFESAAAAALVLGVSLGDLFRIETTDAGVPDQTDVLDKQVLSPAQSRRLTELLDRQGLEQLSDDEQRELHGLVAEYGQRLDELLVYQIAEQRKVSVEQARRELEASFEQALAQRRSIEADPQRRKAVIAAIKQRRKSASR